MANILLVDPDDMAQIAMHGILSRASHRCVAVASGSEALDFLVRNLKIDLLIVEMKLTGEDGVHFIQRLKSDLCFKRIPVVVCTAHRTRENVKSALALGVQNYLLKPYDDEAILAEVAKVVAAPWYETDFVETQPGCRESADSLESPQCKLLQCSLNNLCSFVTVAQVSLTEKLEALSGAMEHEDAEIILDDLAMLHYHAESLGALGVAQWLAFLSEKARSGSWAEFKYGLPSLDYHCRFIFWHLHPYLTPEDFLSEDEKDADMEERSRALWEEAEAKGAYPVLTWDKLQREIEALPSCPVMESVGAAFHMSANGSPASLHPIMDLVDKDPGLMAQILITINQLRKSKAKGGTVTPVEVGKMAIGLLGEVRLATLGRTLLRVHESMMHVAPDCTWLRYWMFQVGTARIAQSICDHLELPGLKNSAYTAGLIHDIGKLLLLRLHPTGFQTILKYALDNRVTMAAAERRHLDATTHQIAAHFADRIGLPGRFASVIRWVASPELATVDSELVAIVAVARHICRQNNIGFSGHAPEEVVFPLENTAAWRVLQGSVLPSFHLKRFESQMKAKCGEFHREVHGQWNETKAKA